MMLLVENTAGGSRQELRQHCSTDHPQKINVGCMACMEYGKFPYEVFSLCFVYKIKN